jgi:hypothetical protein
MNEGEKIAVPVWVTPIASLCKRKNLYYLPDSAYGEWLIFSDENPVYYFNCFDPYYDTVRDVIYQKKNSLEHLLIDSFVVNELDFTTSVRKPFLSFKKKEYSTSIELIKYPIRHLLFLKKNSL